MTSAPDRACQWEVVEAFLAASRAAGFDMLLLCSTLTWCSRAAGAAVRLGRAAKVTRSAAAVAETFKGWSRDARSAVVVLTLWECPRELITRFEMLCILNNVDKAFTVHPGTPEGADP